MRQSEAIKLNGFYRVRLVDKAGNIKHEESHNFVTNNMKKVALAESMNKLFKMNIGNPFGMMLCLDNGQYRENTATGGFLNFNGLSGSAALTVLNLDDSLVMDSTTKYLPILASDGSGIDQAKLTGYSVGRVTSQQNKEGVILDNTSADMVFNQYQIVNTYVWDLDKANGQFNWLAVMPGFDDTPWRAIQAFKCVSSYNIRTSQNSFVGGYVLPDCKDTKGNVLTGPNQILTFEQNGGGSRWFYDIVTGEKRAVQSDELAYNWTNSHVVGVESPGKQVVVGDYLYVIDATSIVQIEIATGATVKTASIAYAAGTQTHPIGMYYDGTNIIVSACTTTTTENRAYVSTVNPSSLAVSKVYNNAFTGWGNLPSGWVPRQCCYTKVGEYYLVQYVGTSYEDMYYAGAVIVCTDLTNVCGTIVGLMDTRAFNSYLVNGEIWSIAQFTENPHVTLKLTDGSSATTQYSYNGVYVSNFEFSNFWSATKLDQVWTKTNEMRLIIDYGYTFE